MTLMTRPAGKRRRASAVRWIQKPAVATKASSTAQQYQSLSWDGQGAVRMYVSDLLNSTLLAPALATPPGSRVLLVAPLATQPGEKNPVACAQSR